MSRHPILRQVLLLARSGVPWDHAWAISSERRNAYVVALGEIDGGDYDWNVNRWKRRP